MWKDMIRDLGMIGFVSYMCVLVGGISWGLYGFFAINILTMIFGGLARVIAIVIGVGTGYLLYEMFKKKKPIL